MHERATGPIDRARKQLHRWTARRTYTGRHRPTTDWQALNHNERAVTPAQTTRPDPSEPEAGAPVAPEMESTARN